MLGHTHGQTSKLIFDDGNKIKEFVYILHVGIYSIQRTSLHIPDLAQHCVGKLIKIFFFFMCNNFFSFITTTP